MDKMEAEEASAKWVNIYHHLKWQALNKYPMIGILIVCSFPTFVVSVGSILECVMCAIHQQLPKKKRKSGRNH